MIKFFRFIVIGVLSTHCFCLWAQTFTEPQEYSDSQLENLQSNFKTAKDASHMAWLRYQQNPSQQTMAVYQDALAKAQELSTNIYRRQIENITKQAQAGNKTAFSSLLNTYSSKIGMPIAVIATQDGSYSIIGKDGQIVGGLKGSTSYIAGAMGSYLLGR